MTNEKLFELHEAVKYARHNGGMVHIPADELLELLLPQPEIVSKPVAEPAVGDNHRPVELAAPGSNAAKP